MLSGVKAHTIRIWEKRYNLLEPERTDTNIRTYNIENLKRLLNVAYLYKGGLKISKIAELKNEELSKLIEHEAAENRADFAAQAFKTAMFTFDAPLFLRTFAQLEDSRSFRQIFSEIFIPMLSDIGYLWQAGAIDPSHERFIAELLKQKIYLHTHQAQQNCKPSTNEVFVLFLPYGEIHEIGILYTNYEIISAGYQTVYLGSNIPMESLNNVVEHFENVTYVGYFTVRPEEEPLQDYLNKFSKIVKNAHHSKFWVLGGKAKEVDFSKLPNNIVSIQDLEVLTKRLKDLKKS